jgi:DNA (cytosine-5)-methyltransferase 1
MISVSNQSMTISAEILSDIISVSKATIIKWEKKGKLMPSIDPITGQKQYDLNQLMEFPEIRNMVGSRWAEELQIVPIRPYTTIELFAGAGGLALGLEMAGFQTIALNEFDRDACTTLRLNRSDWQVIHDDIRNIDFRQIDKPPEFAEVDLIAGGFPCQAFSYAGQKLGFADTRGTLFFEFARALQELQPRVFLAENVRGLLQHDEGKTLATIKATIAELGYTLIATNILNAIFYRVPQKRERLFLVGVRNDLVKFADFKWPSTYSRILVLKDALKAGEIYDCDVPKSLGQAYPKRKQEIMACIPPGGCWKDLPDDLQREYMQGSYFLGGGKTGMARRLSWEEPSLTLLCTPAQKQTERCHPEETRPLEVREYARIQTFPDEWQFAGSISSQYRQIGNAVPVNLAAAVGRSLVGLLNNIELKIECPRQLAVCAPINRSQQLSLGIEILA